MLKSPESGGLESTPISTICDKICLYPIIAFKPSRARLLKNRKYSIVNNSKQQKGSLYKEANSLDYTYSTIILDQSSVREDLRISVKHRLLGTGDMPRSVKARLMMVCIWPLKNRTVLGLSAPSCSRISSSAIRSCKDTADFKRAAEICKLIS